MNTVQDYTKLGLSQPRNLIERACDTGRADEALQIIRDALRITPDEWTADILDRDEFATCSTARRYEMVANYIRAECFASIERDQRLVPAPDSLTRFLASGASKD